MSLDARSLAIDLVALGGIPPVRPGDELDSLIIAALEQAGSRPQTHDVLVVAQKIVSKAENRYVDLAGVDPSERARELAALVDKDPRLVEVILGESREVVRHRPGVLIVAHRLGFVMANAGVDRSNVGGTGDAERVLLLPVNPDRTCAALRAALTARFAVDIGVIISDSVGRAWRHGTVGLALGAAGVPALRDLRGRRDLDGRELEVTQTGFADQVAAAAALLMGEADEGAPVVLVRGLRWSEPALPAASLVRPKAIDLFR